MINLQQRTNCCTLSRYLNNGKNYFLTLQPFGDSQYIFKLQEIANGTTYMLAVWIVTSEDQVHVTIEEYDGNWW